MTAKFQKGRKLSTTCGQKLCVNPPYSKNNKKNKKIVYIKCIKRGERNRPILTKKNISSCLLAIHTENSVAAAELLPVKPYCSHKNRRGFPCLKTWKASSVLYMSRLCRSIFIFRISNVKIYGVFGNIKQFGDFHHRIFDVENSFLVEQADNLFVFIGSGDSRVV